jgi:hypothetical protein
MPAYGSYPNRQQPQTGYGPGAYGYRPGARYSNPFTGWNPSEVEFDYYANNPQAVFGRYLASNEVSGPQGVAPTMRAFLEGWLPDAYQQYQGAIPNNPSMGFPEYLSGLSPLNAYEMTNPYARNLRAGFRTRYLRR